MNIKSTSISRTLGAVTNARDLDMVKMCATAMQSAPNVDRRAMTNSLVKHTVQVLMQLFRKIAQHGRKNAKTHKKTSGFEARQLVEQRTQCSTTSRESSGKRTGVTYAHAWVCVQTQTASNQTELTMPLDSKMPISVANVAHRKAQNSCSVQTETTNNKQLNKQATKVITKVSTVKINRPGLVSQPRRGAAKVPMILLVSSTGLVLSTMMAVMMMMVIRAKLSSPKKKAN